ncbi:MAG: MBL fold metallo-hydrolase [Thermomicrobiales bacterium]|nr:MBL fold metallo-hydrolase [Thermomicrobiales bacterium]
MSSATEALESQIHDLEVEPGTVGLVWLGQASYILKSPSGVIVMIDPYLSDWAEQQWGLIRVIDPPVDPATFQPDMVLISHWHEDHLDAPVIKQWAADGIDAVFVGPDTCTCRAEVWGWTPESIVTVESDDEVEFEDVVIVPTFARHETKNAPTGDAFGYLVIVDGVKIWYGGDTEYDARLRPMRDEEVDVALIPINGVGGNLDADEAAMLMYKVAPKIAVPMHYNMWAPEGFGAGATLDPQQFVQTHTKLEGSAEVKILEVGKIVTFGK